MIHPLTAITFAAFFGAGFYVFQTKEEVAQLDRDLRDIRRQTEAEMSRTQILNAEWARLNDQERLRHMATSHLRHMQPMEPAQFQRLEDAQRRMPQAVAFTPVSTGFGPRTELASAPGEALVFTAADFRPAPAAPAAAPVVVAEAPRPVPARPAPEAPRADAPAAPVLAAAPAPAPAPVPAAAPAPAPAPMVIAATPEAPRAAPRVADPIRPVRAEMPVAEAPRAAPRRARTEIARTDVASLPSVTSASQPPRPAQPPVIHTPASPNSAIPQPAFRTAMAAPVQASGSLIGGGMALPPPVPFGR
ncbi:cell division protein FtsL [Sabulicella rubraurantiaca]|uniref:cell division protein FtsL n=1 Tax=Sabulicella rubraurantiaca TaxID=2811429 RepID=UPI001A956833|nr:hypothetical protein [Sabulicella rubraurantiaca]